MFEVGKRGKGSVLLIDVNEETKKKKEKKGKEHKWVNKYKITLN